MFYDNLKKACEDKGTSITTLLKQFGISTSNGTSWKNGVVPQSNVVIKFAQTLGVSTDYLLLGKKDVEYDNATLKMLDLFGKLSDEDKWSLVGRAELLVEQGSEHKAKEDVS